jgi:type I restriction enzyme, S subunit
VSRFKVIDLLENVVSGEWGQEPTGSNDVKVIRTTNFSNDGRLDLNKELVFRNIEEQKVIEKKLNYGDIIIEKSGGSPEQPVGRVVYFDIKNDIYLCNNFTSILRPDGNKVVNKYLFYYLFYKYKTKAVLKYQNKTTGIINLKLDNYLKSLSIDLPSKETQLKIVSILDKAQELIDKRKAQMEALDQLTQSVFLEMFGDPILNQRGWKLSKLGNLGEFLSGGTPSRKCPEYFKGNIPWITTVSLGKTFIDRSDAVEFITEEAIINSSTKVIPRGSVLFGTRVGVGKVSINLCDLCTNQDIISITNISKDVDKIFLLTILMMYGNYFESQKRGATIKGITSDVLKNISVILPPISLQEKYTNIISMIELQKQKLEKGLIELKINFNSLMQRAFKGELFND